MHTLEYNYTVLFEPAEEGGYTVTVPALPGVVTEGDTLDEARLMAEEAIFAYIESLQQDGQEIPTDVDLDLEPRKEKISVSFAV